MDTLNNVSLATFDRLRPAFEHLAKFPTASISWIAKKHGMDEVGFRAAISEFFGDIFSITPEAIKKVGMGISVVNTPGKPINAREVASSPEVLADDQRRWASMSMLPATFLRYRPIFESICRHGESEVLARIDIFGIHPAAFLSFRRKFFEARTTITADRARAFLEWGGSGTRSYKRSTRLPTK